jgi:hypothetical protein
MINAATFDFLEELHFNNNRDWFHLNKTRHDNARTNVLEFTNSLILKLSKIDPSISADLDSKNCVMRIYRDIRFSKDKTPYKTNFGVGFSENGKNFKGPGYYLQIHPEESLIAGGYWMPEGEHLKAIRQEIDYNGIDFHKIVDNKEFIKYFGSLDEDYKLKTAPKGYQPHHPYIEYLKLKSFTFSHPLTKSELIGSGAVDNVCDGFARLYPFISFLRNSVS